MFDIQSLYFQTIKGILKNRREYIALRHKLYPNFVFEKNPKTLRDEIPVFTLHSVMSQRFEEQLIFLSSNGYKTINADELYACLVGNTQIKERTIVLTFDDGWKNLFTVAYPLLKKYGFTAICFLIAGLIPERRTIQTNKDKDVDDSKILCSWEEIRVMHESGVIDFQSHSMYHCLIYTSSEIVDFFHPRFDTYTLNMDVPLIRSNENENYSRDLLFGTPIYSHDSRFSGKKRYLDDENLRGACTKFVEKNGGERFFRNVNWRKQLHKTVKNFGNQNRMSSYFEDENQLRKNIYDEFSNSKLLIENKLPGKNVNHFCYPWWVGSDLALEISKEAGYKSNYWGVLSDKRTNIANDDPYKISRILSDDYIFRLPGYGRKSNTQIIWEKLFQNKNFLKKFLE